VAVAPAENVQHQSEPCNPPACDTDTITCPDCKAENKSNTERCVYCDFELNPNGSTKEQSCVELAWPWATELLTKSIRIGRNPPAPENIIKAINSYGYNNISRSHADIAQDPATGIVSVTDLGSTNGTYVDGVKIIPNKPTVLKNKAVVRFASGLSVTVFIRITDPDS
jgi:hypothetical protein